MSFSAKYETHLTFAFPNEQILAYFKTIMPEYLSIVIPAYNEERSIHLILDKVKAVTLIGGLQKEIIITNDCSKDDTEGRH